MTTFRFLLFFTFLPFWLVFLFLAFLPLWKRAFLWSHELVPITSFSFQTALLKVRLSYNMSSVKGRYCFTTASFSGIKKSTIYQWIRFRVFQQLWGHPRCSMHKGAFQSLCCKYSAVRGSNIERLFVQQERLRYGTTIYFLL